MSDNIDDRIECFNRVGEYILNKTFLNKTLKPKHQNSLDSFISGTLDAPSKEMAKEFLYRLGYDVEEWQGREDEMYVFSESHLALAAFKLSENLEGIKKIKGFMKEKKIPYDSGLEGKIMDFYSEMDDKRIKEMIELYD